MLEKIINIFQNPIIINVIWVIIILVIGMFFSKKLGEITSHTLKKFKLNKAMQNLNWSGFLKKHNTQINAEWFFGGIVKIFFILLTVMICIEILGFSVLNEFLLQIVNYYPNIFIACIIFIFAVYVMDFSKKIVFVSSDNNDFKYSNAIGHVVSVAVWVLSILAILYQLKIVPDLILTIFIGVVAMFAIIFGLSFGLGGVDIVKEYLKDIQKKNIKK